MNFKTRSLLYRAVRASVRGDLRQRRVETTYTFPLISRRFTSSTIEGDVYGVGCGDVHRATGTHAGHCTSIELHYKQSC
ncbi:hypothetical protein O3G_MSEX004942 [Manduca sexta]|uniref:Uncharacterized protein n=1 Tax=Manduca sexta TaxID=7130 RepID=A0A921YYF6_MANSE|nr:hypothetical protein O3G_MSEX004942 [Manduca sexta]